MFFALANAAQQGHPAISFNSVPKTPLTHPINVSIKNNLFAPSLSMLVAPPHGRRPVPRRGPHKQGTPELLAAIR